MENKKPNEKQIIESGTHYSDSKLMDKIKSVAKKAGIKVISAALLLFQVLKSDNTPSNIKMIIVGSLGYFIFPFDIIPDPIPVIGYGDDLGALIYAIKKATDYITPEMKEKVKSQLTDWFGPVSDKDLAF